MTWRIYRLYSTADELLYIGVSKDPQKRLRHLRADNPDLMDRAVRQNVECRVFLDKSEAWAAERAAIAVERPPFNVCHVPGRSTWGDRQASARG